ncbi:crossover junction endodeoxyribonuclease RuvC [Schlesneria sp. T3-172]|uniref:crossover junction endodeoxyribonuclease RuvC n=1 Tax=Schlesneria sphaerica TaxID=3373610 RepID=UPI0037C934EC
MNHVIGIDPSLSGTGVIVLTEAGSIASKTIVSTPPCGPSAQARMDRYEKMVWEIKKIGDAFKPTMICIEGYAFGSNMPGANERVEYGGLLRYVLTRSFRLIEVNPLSLKKWATGRGAGDKTALIAAMTAKYGVQFGSSDEYDAYALARVALQIVGYDQPTNETQRECVDIAINGKAKKPKKARAAK